MATVVLPPDWEQRLQPLLDEAGEIVARCVEIHDVAISKLVAGRDKDWEFLREAFLAEYLNAATFIERARLLQEMPQQAVLRPRLTRLRSFLEKTRDLRAVTKALQDFHRELERAA